MAAIWASILPRVQELLAADCVRGARHLLTEDRLRWHLIVALGEAGIPIRQLRTEATVPGIGPIDLVIGEPPIWQIELKFPRDPTVKNAPDTMTTGELLRDFARLAGCPSSEGGMAIQVIPDRLRDHLTRRRDVRWAWTPNEVILLSPALLDALPKTARGAIGLARLEEEIGACCIYSGHTADLSLLAYTIPPSRQPPVFEARKYRNALVDAKTTPSVGALQP